MVNRGWVPSSWEDNVKEISAAPDSQGRVTVTGIVQPSETPSSAVPDNKPDSYEFHWLDVPTMVRVRL